jgi:hypothetical protein
MANPRLCSIPECGKPRAKRNYCYVHYKRWRRHGDPLAGRTVRGEPLKFYRELLAYEGDDCIRWPFAQSRGYGTLFLNGKFMRVTRLLCEARHGPPPSPKHEAAHSCGNGHLGCSNRWHLHWATHQENMADTIAHNTSTRGERCASAKLKTADVTAIRELYPRMTKQALAAMFAVSRRTVASIVQRETWAWLD